MSAARPWDHLITVSDVLALYTGGLRYGGESSPPKPGCLEQSVGNAYTAELYSESAFLPGLAFSGYLLYYLTRDHCFVDGNKRIAWLCAMRVLGTIPLTLNASIDDAETLCKRIADSTRDDAIRDGSQVVMWFAEHVELVENP